MHWSPERGLLQPATSNTYPGIVSDLRVRHTLAIAALVEEGTERSELLKIMDTYLDEFATLCHSVGVLGEVTPRAMDTISSLGERINARIVAACLRQMGIASQAVDATELIVTDNRYQQAAPLMDLTRARAQESPPARLWQRVLCPVVTGFIGATEDGHYNDFGTRGQ